jgi:hypothetical protein
MFYFDTSERLFEKNHCAKRRTYDYLVPQAAGSAWLAASFTFGDNLYNTGSVHVGLRGGSFVSGTPWQQSWNTLCGPLPDDNAVLKQAVADWLVGSGAAYDTVLANYGAVSEWDVSQVQDFSQVFGADAARNTFDEDVGGWDTSAATSMENMFEGNTVFNRDLNWDTANVISFYKMFRDSTAFNGAVPFVITTDAAKNVDMSEMFFGATAFNRPVAFDTQRVTNFMNLFRDAAALNQPVLFDLSGIPANNADCHSRYHNMFLSVGSMSNCNKRRTYRALTDSYAQSA